MPETAVGLESVPPPAPPKVGAAAVPPAAPRNNVKETVISLTIAFALAFVFRGFVVEAFLIPTGSMAPTLNGQNMLMSNPQTGYTWAVGPSSNPRDMVNGVPMAIQGASSPITVVDPILRNNIGTKSRVRLRGGDRIFVMKYLSSIFDPARYDVVVFKNPSEPQVNYIKRLIGLPGDQLALIDGDVWVRTPSENDPIDVNPWTLPGWKVATKPELAQRSMWQLVFDSQYTPKGGSFQSPWRVPSESHGMWDIAGKQDYRYEPKNGATSTSLFWDPTAPVRDYYAYNEQPATANGEYPVSDQAISMGVKPDADGMVVSAVVNARHHEFRAQFKGTSVMLQMREAPTTPDAGSAPTDPAWTTLTTATIAQPLKGGVVTDIEFWHVDQTLEAFVNGKSVAKAAYDWTPGQRLTNSTTFGADWEGSVAALPKALNSPQVYLAGQARMEFEGGALTISRVTLKRDIYYRPDVYKYNTVRGHSTEHSRLNQPALATAPSSTLTLGPDEFFCCGDNSPASSDGRLWDNPDAWVQAIDPKIGVVPRDLMIGKAFFVYFPAPNWRGSIPIPDFGRMRFIW